MVGPMIGASSRELHESERIVTLIALPSVVNPKP
jgi:hypothetical protein